MASKFNRKDNDGHKFNVPVVLLELFDESLEEYSRCKRFSEEYYEVERRFNYNFEMYMVG